MVGNTLGNFKKKKLNYLDIVFLCLHLLIISFPLILVYENIVLTIIGIIFATTYFASILYTFIKNNPFYIYYCYGLFFLAFLFLMASLLIIPWLGFIVIPQFIYFYILVKIKRQFETLEGHIKMDRRIGFRHRRYGGRIPFGISGARDLISLEEKLKIKQQKMNLNAKFHVQRIRAIAIILTVGLFIIYVITGSIIYRTYGIDYTLP